MTLNRLLEIQEGSWVADALMMDESKPKELKGVKGWLALYAWGGLILESLGVLGFLLVLVFADMTSPENNFYNFHLLEQIDLVIANCLGLANICACFLLLRLNQKAVTFVTRVLTASVSYHGILLGSSLFNETLRPLFLNGGTFIPFIVALAWLQYFKLSKRVQNTYPQ